jgi:cytochrome c-type biogenesis protein CcmH
VTYAALIGLAAVALLPLLLALSRAARGRDRRDAALALHRAQLAELDRDLTEQRISPAEHAAALLEVQRRLLAADSLAGPVGRIGGTAGRLSLVGALVAIPLAAFGLYLVGGRPGLPGEPMAARLAAADADVHSASMLIAMLRERLAQPGLEPARAREGWVLLGNAEDSEGHLAQAAQAWRQAVRLRFDPSLAALAAEAQTRVEGSVSADSRALFTRALAEGPKDAPWRHVAEQRTQQK